MPFLFEDEAPKPAGRFQYEDAGVIQADNPAWKQRLHDWAYSLIPGVGLGLGGVAGTVAAGPEPLAPVAGAAGAGMGYATGRKLAAGLDQLIGFRNPPSARPTSGLREAWGTVRDVGEGAVMDVGGQVAGKALGTAIPYVGSRLRDLINPSESRTLARSVAGDLEGLSAAEITANERAMTEHGMTPMPVATARSEAGAQKIEYAARVPKALKRVKEVAQRTNLEAQQAVARFLDDIAPANSALDTGRRAQEAAAGARADLVTAQKEATAPLYKQAWETAGTPETQRVLDTLDAIQAEADFHPEGPTGKVFGSIRKQLTDTVDVPVPEPAPAPQRPAVGFRAEEPPTLQDFPSPEAERTALTGKTMGQSVDARGGRVVGKVRTDDERALAFAAKEAFDPGTPERFAMEAIAAGRPVPGGPWADLMANDILTKAKTLVPEGWSFKPPMPVRPMVPDIEPMIKTTGDFGPLAQPIKPVAVPPGKTVKEVVPADRLRRLDSVKRYIDDVIQGKIPTATGIDAEGLVALQKARDALMAEADAASPGGAYAAARAAHQAHIPGIQAFDASLPGGLARKETDRTVAEAADRFIAQASKSPDLMRQARAIIAGKDPEAWAGIVRQYFEGQLRTIPEATGNQGLRNVPRLILKKLFETGPQRELTRAVLEDRPEVAGRLETLMKALDAASLIYGRGSPTAPFMQLGQAADLASGASAVEAMAKGRPIAAGIQAAVDFSRNMLREQWWDNTVKALTDPAMGKELKKLAAMPRGSLPWRKQLGNVMTSLGYGLHPSDNSETGGYGR